MRCADFLKRRDIFVVQVNLEMTDSQLDQTLDTLSSLEKGLWESKLHIPKPNALSVCCSAFCPAPLVKHKTKAKLKSWRSRDSRHDFQHFHLGFILAGFNGADCTVLFPLAGVSQTEHCPFTSQLNPINRWFLVGRIKSPSPQWMYECRRAKFLAMKLWSPQPTALEGRVRLRYLISRKYLGQIHRKVL